MKWQRHSPDRYPNVWIIKPYHQAGAVVVRPTEFNSMWDVYDSGCCITANVPTLEEAKAVGMLYAAASGLYANA